MTWTNTRISIVVVAVVLVASVATFKLGWPKIREQLTRHQGRADIAGRAVTPVSMTNDAATAAASLNNINGFPGNETIARGFQVIDNVPFQIDGMLCLYGKAFETQFHHAFPEKFSDFRVNRKFETMYVYQCTYFGAPSGEPVCGIIFNYEDGSSATNVLRYGEDMLDLMHHGPPSQFAGPSAPRSQLGWVGGTFSTNVVRPLRFCITAIENPRPSLHVDTVDWYSCKNQASGCILAMTAGKSGQMKEFVRDGIAVKK